MSDSPLFLNLSPRMCSPHLSDVLSAATFKLTTWVFFFLTPFYVKEQTVSSAHISLVAKADLRHWLLSGGIMTLERPDTTPHPRSPRTRFFFFKKTKNVFNVRSIYVAGLPVWGAPLKFPLAHPGYFLWASINSRWGENPTSHVSGTGRKPISPKDGFMLLSCPLG